MRTIPFYCALAIILFVFLTISAEENGGLLPDSLSRPQKGEAARYPEDMIIGELGIGEASEEAYGYAKKVIGSLLGQQQKAEGISGDVWQRTKASVDAVSPQKFRLGGGRKETDGNTSFIFRFIGRERWVVGEIYVRFQDAVPVPMQKEDAAQDDEAAAESVESGDPEPAEPPDENITPAEIEYTQAGWRVDDILLDDPKHTGESGAVYQYDFSPYERFF
ncbi:MAG: hypothetical protein LBD58_07060 [Treponema sp.]|jgi:hypothetical protein|nr:hypothetical protein [Treponema sp.]